MCVCEIERKLNGEIPHIFCISEGILVSSVNKIRELKRGALIVVQSPLELYIWETMLKSVTYIFLQQWDSFNRGKQIFNPCEMMFITYKSNCLKGRMFFSVHTKKNSG